jgi:RNA polymerase sigma-54 factor
MAIELRQQLKLTQQLIMTPQLQMAIKLLQLSRLELVDTIRQELEENPTLEEVQETPDRNKDSEPEEPPAAEADEAREVTIEEKINDEIDWSNYIDEYNSPGKVSYESESREAPQYEAFVSSKESLSDHLLWQLLMLSPTDIEKQVGSLIIGNLNRDGYLQLSVEELTNQSGISVEMVEDVLETMQSFDPVGVCARDLRECLLLQVQMLKLENSLVTDDHLRSPEEPGKQKLQSHLQGPEG